MPKKRNSENSEQLQLFIPYSQKPFLEYKKKVRGKDARKGFDLIEEGVRLLQAQLDQDGIHSAEAKPAIQQFLILTQGDKTRLR
ncbi:hypothetical protein [Lyngbya sp. PCC 8106]|uniref:hypothetical protein n=1 Tax=Lyngbya sp. (strain PCC 8106) TaxID=313612 RepID=UPI0000EAC6BE|nr:hypothetical protein [Lyngbya sp. PCC 8106]EAW34722.1 hypothetical protein L8106_25430 [Lyngbya sp. PCC 8106]